MTVTITKCPLRDRPLKFVQAVQDSMTDRLGFFTPAAFREKAEDGRIWIASVSGSVNHGCMVGYLMHGSLASEDVRIFQVGILEDWRGKGIGRALVNHLYGRAQTLRSTGGKARRLSLRVRCDLTDAIAFYHAMGFSLTLEGDTPGIWVMTRIVSTSDSRTACPERSRREGK